MESIWQAIRDVSLRLKLLVTGGVLLRVGPIQANGVRLIQVQLLAGERKAGIGMQFLQPYGLATYPLEGAGVQVISRGGDRSEAVGAMIHDRRYEPDDLQEGEVVVFTHAGQEIRLMQGNKIRLRTQDGGSEIMMSPDRIEIRAATLSIKVGSLEIDKT